MRIFALAAALLIGTLSLLPEPAHAARRAYHHRGTMSVTLADGRTIRFRLMMMGGRMMAVAPVPYLYPGWTGGR